MRRFLADASSSKPDSSDEAIGPIIMKQPLYFHSRAQRDGRQTYRREMAADRVCGSDLVLRKRPLKTTTVRVHAHP